MSQDQNMSCVDGTNLGRPTLLLSALPSPPPQTQEHSSISTSTAVKTEEGHSRPLPPPHNQTDVRRQALKLSGWTVLDDEGDIMISTAPSKRTSASLQDDEFTEGTVGDQEAFNGSFVSPRIGTTYRITEGSHTNNHPSKKRRIFNPDQREALMRSVTTPQVLSSPPTSPSASHHPDSNVSLSDGIELMQPTDATQRVFNIFDDESITSSNDLGEDDPVFSPGEKETSSAPSNTSDDEELVRYHARLHHKSMSTTQVHSDPGKAEQSKRWSLTGEAMDSVLARKEKDEQESVKRSQMLRERKLDRATAYSPETSDFDFFEDHQVPSLSKSGVSDFDVDNRYTDNFPGHVHDNDRSQSPRPSTYTFGQHPEKPQIDGDFEDTLLSDNEPDVESLLDFSQSYNQRQMDPRGHHERNARRGRPIINRSRGHHKSSPFSRIAAERYRTQGRHLDSPYSVVHSTPSNFSLVAGEARLRHFTEMQVQPKPTVQYLQPDCNSRHITEPLTCQPHSSLAQEESTPNSGSSSPSRMLDSPVSPTTNPRWKRNLTTAQLQAVQSRREPREKSPVSSVKTSAVKRSLTQITRDSYGPLGAMNDIDRDDLFAVVAEHERLKHQQKDLTAILETFEEIASRLCIDSELTEVENKEVRDARKYATAVVDQELPGRLGRVRMSTIKGNMLRRRLRAENDGLVGEEDEATQNYISLIGESRLKRINEALEFIEDPIIELGAHRSKLRSKTKSGSEKPSAKKSLVKHPKKRVRFAAEFEDEDGRIRRDLQDGTIIDLDGAPTSKPRPKKLTKEERNINALQNTLKRFEKRQAGSDGDDSEDEANTSHRIQGSSFMSSKPLPHGTQPEGLQLDQDIDEINRLEDERQQAEAQATNSITTDKAAPRPQAGQKYDPELFAKMQEKNSKIGRLVMTGEGVDGEEVEFADWTDTESLEESDSDESDTDITATTQVYKYTVKGQFAGLEIYKGGVEYIFKSFHQFNKASAYVRKIIDSAFKDYDGKHGKSTYLQSREDGDYCEQMLEIGKNDEIQVRVWTHREMVEIDLAKQTISKARKRRLVDIDVIYQVSWEKTVTTTITQPGQGTVTSGNDAPVTNEEDDLFGPEPPAAPEITVMTEMCPETVLHRDLAAANRLAKEDFMTWYSQHFPEKERRRSYLTAKGLLGYEYSGMLALVNQAKERELERLGELGMFDCEEEVDVMLVGDAEGAGEWGGAGKGVEAVRKEVKEKMRVFVSERPLLGPTN